jgi:sarcosine oxidase subunit beta
MSTSQINPDVLIIGAGIMGSSLAYHLARRGSHVLVIERTSPAVEPAASWASAGGVRRQGRHPAEAALASEAIERWPTLEQELEADVRYHQGGNLLLAESDEEAEQIAAFVQQQRTLGFSDVRLVDRREAQELALGLNERVVAGSYSPRDGQADPMLTTRAFATAAQRHSATFWNNTAVQALIAQNGRVTGIRTAQGDINAGYIVLAAGAWGDELVASIGLRLPVYTLALQMVLSTPAPASALQPVLSALGRKLSLKQLPGGSFLIGGGWEGDPAPDRQSYILRNESVEGNWATACGLLPIVGQQRIQRAWCGLEALSVDGIPFIGHAPGLQGLILALGFSGHGFALSPAVGRSLADLIEGRLVPELAGLSPQRIAQLPDHPQNHQAGYFALYTGSPVSNGEGIS